MSTAVHDMFAGIAKRYDVANDVLSFGIHRLWRRNLVKKIGVGPGMQVLDLCTGTGDLALILSRLTGPAGRVVGLDFVAAMLELAEKKLHSSTREGCAPISFLQGDAMSIPFPDGSFDAVTIAFGIRNVDDPAGCLREIHRVLKPGGRLGVLEFGQPTVPGFSAVYRFYSKHIMPLLGGAITGDRQAYVYLPETSRNFPAGRNFETIVRAQNFEIAATKALFGGIAFVYSAKRAGNPASGSIDGKNPRNSVETGLQFRNV